MTPAQQALVRRLKARSDPHDPEATIPVADASQQVVGTLVVIDGVLAGTEQVIRALTRWRARFAHCFLTQFTPTAARTKHWLHTVVLADDHRLLFLLRDEAGRAVGHIGLCGLQRHSAELDNVMRARRARPHRIMFFAALALLRFAFGPLDIERVVLRVFSNNAPALRLYQAVGFAARRRLALRQRQQGDARVYFVDAAHSAAAPEFHLVEMTLHREAFFRKHPWLKAH